jgi:hypothetical protein
VFKIKSFDHWIVSDGEDATLGQVGPVMTKEHTSITHPQNVR